MTGSWHIYFYIMKAENMHLGGNEVIFDFKKEYKDIYQAKAIPSIVNIPKMNYIAVRGKGDPNDSSGDYQKAIQVLYSVAYTLKMSYKTDYKIDGFFQYVVPPLEGFWWQDGVKGVDYTDKSSFNWISVIRLPDFITKEHFDWGVEMASTKKKLDCSSAKFFTLKEGLCVQILHVGPFDDEPESIEKIEIFLKGNNYICDINEKRLHHEIYLSDFRKVSKDKLKTILRHPIRRLIMEKEG